MATNKSLFQLFKDSPKMSSMICEKIKNSGGSSVSENYECKLCYGTEFDLLFKEGSSHKGIYSKNAITNFFGELGAVECKDSPNKMSDVTKWVVMNGNVDKIYTFGSDDDEFHITRRPPNKY